MAENLVLDGLREVFPHVDFSTLIEVSIQFKDDIDAAADYIIENVIPNIVPDPSHADTNNEDLYIHGHQLALDDANTQLGPDPVHHNTNSNPIEFDQTNKTPFEKDDSLMVKQLKKSLTGLCPEVFDVPSTSGHNCACEDSVFDTLLADSQPHACSERNPEISASDGDMPLCDDSSPHVTLQSSYSVNLESLDDVIADEHFKKNALMSNIAVIRGMLKEVEINEENTKHAISDASQAGNDILVKVEELKEMTALAVEDNNKVEGEISAEKSILATEAQELQTRLFSISEETKNFVLTIDEMHNTLHRRLIAAEAERVAAEKAKHEREASAQISLKEQELSLEAAKNHSKRLEQQVLENANLRELLTDRGHVVDALHGEMLGIFDSITQLKLKVDIQLPVDEQRQQVSSTLSSSAVHEPPQVPVVLSSSVVDKPSERVQSILSGSAVVEPLQQVSPILAFDEQLHQYSSILSSTAFDEPLQLVSSRLSTSMRSTRSDGSLAESLTSKSSWSSGAESNVSLMDDETADVSVGDFALDDSWDVVDDEDTFESPVRVKSTPMLL